MIDNIALVDTTRPELRERISLARDRFDRLARSADPLARPPGSTWTVQQVVAHVLTVARRYQGQAQGRGYRRAATPRGVDVINQDELQAAIASVAEMTDQLQALTPELDRFFDSISTDDTAFPFHGGVMVSGLTGQTNWIGELLLHGQDIARAVKAPWEIAERDMLLVLRGVMEIIPAYLRTDVSADTDVMVAFTITAARPYLIHIHDGVAEARPRRADDRPDAVLRAPASTLIQLLYQRIGPYRGTLHGLRVVGGRRPWKALKLQSYFERA
ncbi:MAG: maleylpyruvate isomerase N-terminal domain-containing protein [Mycobacteriaceae bacterium]|nr:maleylpyruvate isomerase N-terminal domain-containing protein [Mycobacteriaceae bacterium]MBV9515994.1 maleylpyruvate isomerase N-terminal domain-containing protein [Mycobacteriaceae bacterium]